MTKRQNDKADMTEEATPHHPVFRSQCVLGAPVSCLSLPSDSLIVYSQGGWLERRSLHLHHDDTLSKPRTHDRLLALTSGTIHGIRYAAPSSTNHDLSIVFGGNQIAFLEHVLDTQTSMRMIQLGDDDSLTLSDWIWDCQWQDDAAVLAVGLAHNIVQLWEIKVINSKSDEEGQEDAIPSRSVTARCLRQVVGSSRTISYCMHLNNGLVAVGLPLRDILVWSYNDNDDSPQESVLKGHAGCIHSVRFNDDNTLLASASDDRTVRLWKRQNNIDDNDSNTSMSWTLAWTAYGHSARCWSVAFSDYGVLSTGEDGTAMVWDTHSGSQLAVLRGHACQCVWRVASLGALAVTGAQDGSVAVYNLVYAMRRQRRQLADSDTCSSSWEDTILVSQQSDDVCKDTMVLSDDLPVEENGVGTTKAKKKNKAKEKHQAFVGMEFVARTGMTPHLLVATRRGTVLMLELESGKYQQASSPCNWWDASLEEQDVSPADGCCFSVSPSGTQAAVGTIKGNIVIVDLNDSHRESHGELLPARDHRTVQKICWISSSAILSLHIQTIIFWSKADAVDGNLPMPQFTMRQVFRPGTKGMPICCSLNASKTLMVAGDTRGNLALFAFNSQADEVAAESLPLSTLRAHGREHVTVVSWMDGRVLSVGNDGCLHDCIVLQDGMLVALKSIQVSSFSGLDRLWCLPGGSDECSVIVGGYFGNTYAVMNVQSGYEILRVETGGRQRSTCLFIESLQNGQSSTKTGSELRQDRNAEWIQPMASGTSCCFAVSAAGVGGHKEIQLYCCKALGWCSNSIWNTPSRVHGEAIFDCCLFALNTDSFALVTASEDCHARVTYLRNGRQVATELLPAQAGGVRAVCQCRLPGRNMTLVAAGGGKLELQFFVIHDLSAGSTGRPLVEHVGSGRPAERACIDHRINSLAAASVPASFANGTDAVVAAGDSSGRIYLYAFSSNHRGLVRGSLLCSGERPVLSLAFVEGDEGIKLLVVGTTGGDVTLFSLPEATLTGSKSGAPIFSYRAHQVGTNSVSARIIPDLSGRFVVRICSGGDDQSVHCCEIHSDELMQSPLRSFWQCQSAGGTSAIRGLAFIDDGEHVVICGYDRELRLFRLSNQKLQFVSSLPVAPGDLNCLSHSILEGVHIIAVAGAGVDICELRS